METLTRNYLNFVQLGSSKLGRIARPTSGVRRILTVLKGRNAHDLVGSYRPRLCQNVEARIICRSQWWVKPNEAIH